MGSEEAVEVEKTYIDIHTHILPEIDDGPEKMQDAVGMLIQARENQTGVIVATSHYCPDRWAWDRNRYLEQFQMVQENAEKMNILLYSGNEIYYTSRILDALERGECMSLNGGRYVLTEFDHDIWGRAMEQALMSLRYEGYFPVVPHAERCGCLTESISLVESLVRQGVYIQVNCDSVIRAHKRRLHRSPVKTWLKEELVHVIATDMHDTEARPSRMKLCGEILKKYYGPVYSQKLLEKNPEAMINDCYISDI